MSTPSPLTQTLPIERGWRARLRRLHFAREGIFWGLLALGLLATGLAKGINLITLLACMLLATIALNALLSARQLRRVRVRRLDTESPFARTPWSWTVQVMNTSNGSARGVRVQAGGEHGPRVFLDELPAGQTTVLHAEVVFPQRGLLPEGPLQLTSGYPFGLAQLTHGAGTGRDLIVLPQLGALQRGALRALLRWQANGDGQAQMRGQRHPAAHAIFHGLRAYVPGDNPRSIHWRTSARRGEPTVREFEDMPEDDLTLIVAARRTEAGAPALERLISFAATVCWEWCRQHGDHFLLALAGAETHLIGGLTGPLLARRMLERLALEQGADAIDATDLVARLRTHGLPGGPVLLLGPPDGVLTEVLRRGLRRPVVALDGCNEKEGGLFRI